MEDEFMKFSLKKAAAVLVVVWLAALLYQVSAWAAPAAVPHAAQQTGARLTLLQAILVAAGYWLTNSAFTPNLGFNFFRWPLIGGTMVGLIMGDLGQGILLGASINLVFLGVIVAGASVPADPSLAGWLGTALAMSAGLGTQQAIAIAAPLGALGTIAYYSRMSVDVGFVRWANEAADRGDIDRVALVNWLPGQVFVFLTTFIPVLILALVGSTALKSLFDAIDPFRGGSADWRWVRDWLIIAGAVLPAVGIALNLSLIFNRAVLAYLLIFFTVAALTQTNIIAIAVIALGLAFLHIMMTRREESNATGS
jgi:mannose/fructose/N-acetylgalactosamine-specific phosphotransferase system component IIC